MKKLIQKKFSISPAHKSFLENYQKWGYSDQSSIVRDALNRFIKDLKAKERKRKMEQKANELFSDYKEGGSLAVLSNSKNRKAL